MMYNEKCLKLLKEKGVLSYLDIHFARFATRLAGRDDPEIFLAAALLSSYKEQGHVCLDLSSVGGKPLFIGDKAEETVICPEPDKWQSTLEKSSVVGRPGQYKPLILDGRSRLFLYRYWEYQEKLSVYLKKHVYDDIQDINIQLLKEGLERLFPERAVKEVDWQKIATFTALTKKLSLIKLPSFFLFLISVAPKKVILKIILEATSRNLPSLQP